MFLNLGCRQSSVVKAQFPRAQPRVRSYTLRQSILLITEIIFHYFISSIALKAAEIDTSEVTQKVDNFDMLRKDAVELIDVM